MRIAEQGLILYTVAAATRPLGREVAVRFRDAESALEISALACTDRASER